MSRGAAGPIVAAAAQASGTPMLDEYLAPLRAALDDPAIHEVCINRPHEIWTEGRGGWQRHAAAALSFQHCRQLATLIAGYNGKALAPERPFLSARLPGGERIQIVIPPACEPHTVSLSIRRPSLHAPRLEELEAAGAFATCAPAEPALQDFESQLLELRQARRFCAFLDLAVRRQRNILVVGRTGSGKTTLTRSLTASIPSSERLITIEDVHELQLPNHANRVHLFYARSDEGGARVTAGQALASCLRMKPDRILLAELRGDEAWDFIKSVNTGHPGSISTMHANGALEAFEQLTALVKDSPTGAHLAVDDIRQRLFATVDIVLFCRHYRLQEIYYDPERRQRPG